MSSGRDSAREIDFAQRDNQRVVRVRQAFRSRRRFDLRRASVRVSESSLPILQITAASIVSYLIAVWVFGHPYPVVALIVTISTLGLQRDARPRMVLETALGMVMGIALSEISLLLFGVGLWQLTLVLIVVLLAGRFFSASQGFAVVAAIQAALVQVLPAPDGGPFTRSLDGLVAGVVALLFTALIPRDARRAPKRAAQRLFAEWNTALSSLSAALNLGDPSQAERALNRLRGTQRIIDQWAEALDSAQSLAKISPFARRHAAEIVDLVTMHNYMDLATRNLRVVTRRSVSSLEDGVARPELAQLVVSLSAGVSLLGQSIEDRTLRRAACENLGLLAPRLDPKGAEADDSLRDWAIVLSLRPLLADLFRAAGLSPVDTRKFLSHLE
ncbi:FUSC family protein [Lysinibacter sp. HNR]|uniref:FUSC family protein n=1 Tax=Lysinibacter sp. HNR TaxID=3031408 RepID=UPI00243487A9|nr:FUSC family protein [Lysinibacter sp. HNR]WGD38121.1 FUSC family protein [Lysinibacter sp. HNR]